MLQVCLKTCNLCTVCVITFIVQLHKHCKPHPLHYVPLASPANTVPTYEDYSKRVDPHWLDIEVDDGREKDLHIYEIAKVLVKWEEIAPFLGLDPVKVIDISSSGVSGALKRCVTYH